LLQRAGLSTDRFFKSKEENKMKINRIVLLVAACLFDAALSLVTYRAGASTAHSKLNSQWIADGGAPTPPWPPQSQLIADGGAPTPPWPKLPSKLTLVADGGAPTPPWPKPPATNQGA
jgi:hypothetical protein